MRPVKFKFLGVFFGIVAVYFIIYYFFFENYHSFNKVFSVSLKHVVVHLDLKGSPPKLKYLTSLLPLFKRLGVNGILMEYEDSFPYQGTIANLSSTKPYNKSELKLFLTQAMNLEIDIIPLVQTFGHMEHALKLKQYKHLREVHDQPDSICPSNEESINLIKEMLRQIVKFHTSIKPLKHIHIGCDEVYHLNKCHRCRHKKLSNRDLFMNHVRTVKALVHDLDPSIAVLIWDDMFRQIKKHEWTKRLIQIEEVEPVYWDYSPQIKHVSHSTLYHYHNTFKNIWIASAFKGADGKQANYPNITNRYQNHYSWLNFIMNYVFAGEQKVFKFKGIILTGWSRYSHLDPLCDLLPASLSSLVMNLLLIERFQHGVNVADTLKTPGKFFDKRVASKLGNELKCADNVLNFKNIDATIDTCKYKGSPLVSMLRRHQHLLSDIGATFRNDMGTISLVEYYSNIQNLNVKHAENSIIWCKTILKEIARWEKEMSFILLYFYDKFVIEEYIGYKMYSTKRKIKDILQKLYNYKKIRTWDRRPYNFSFT